MPTLEWIGKQAVVNHHREVPFRLLQCDLSLSVGDSDSGNLLVQGDNLEALKALLPYYAGKVKCIYIDPPYNTGNEGWTYNDNVNSPEIKAWLGKVVGSELEDLSRHDKWLCMMYPRLVLLREFLREDGVIFVSIDDNEVDHLQLAMAEVFGRANQIALIVWEKGKKGDSKLVSVTHEYILTYARSKKSLARKGIKWRREKAGTQEVLSHHRALCVEHAGDHEKVRQEMLSWYRGLSKGDPRKAHKHYNWSDDRGLYFAADFAGPDDGRENRPRYNIPHPITGKACKIPSTGWRWEEPRTKAALAENPPRIHFGKDHTTIPNRKSYLHEVDQEPMQSVFYKDGRAATLELEALLGPNAFPFPKDSDVIAGLLSMVTAPGDTVLDSFCGSGTTGHAVLKCNQGMKEPLRFILIEIEETVAVNKARERLRRIVEGNTSLNGNARAGVTNPIGFRFCTLGAPLFDEMGAIRESVKFPELAAHVFFTETGSPIPRKAGGETPLLGVHAGRAIYLLFNGVLGDKRPQGGNVLTREVLASLPPHDGPRVVYGESCRIGQARLRQENIIFKQVPYDVQVR